MSANADSVPCGSWRVVRFIEGYEYEMRWCERITGPCPFPATLPAKEATGWTIRPCAAQNVGCGADS